MDHVNYTIDQIDLHWGKMPVDLHFSYGAVNEFAFTIVRLRAGDVEGTGEVMVTPDESILHKVEALLGRDARQLDSLLPTAATSDLERIFFEGVSIALYDLVGLVCGLPMHSLLGGKTRGTVILMPCTFPTSPQDAQDSARRFFDQGYTRLKVKLIGDLQEDRARVAAIRSVAPPQLVLQGDANEGYQTLESATQAVISLGEAGLNLFEDPLRGNVDDYRQLCQACRDSPAMVMVDALARRTSDLAQVLAAQAADIINIHPDQPGSLSKVIHHARMIQAFGVPVTIGGTGYTAVGAAAYQHVTSVVHDHGPCGEMGGFFDHHMPVNLVEQTLPMHDGAVTIPDTPGHGVNLDMQALAKLQTGYKKFQH